MSGMHVGGKIMVQEPCASGFDCKVYPSRLEAAIQLLRVEIRRSTNPEATIKDVQGAVSGLLEGELAYIRDDEALG